MSYGSQSRNPHEHTEQDEQDEPIYCRGCRGHLVDGRDQIYGWNGWPWCADCIKTVQPVVEDLARSHRIDEDRDDFNEARR